MKTKTGNRQHKLLEVETKEAEQEFKNRKVALSKDKEQLRRNVVNAKRAGKGWLKDKMHSQRKLKAAELNFALFKAINSKVNEKQFGLYRLEYLWNLTNDRAEEYQLKKISLREFKARMSTISKVNGSGSTPDLYLKEAAALAFPDCWKDLLKV